MLSFSQTEVNVLTPVHVLMYPGCYLLFISLFSENEFRSILFEVRLKTAIGHEWCHNEGGGASVNTHTNQTQDIGVIKITHLDTLSHQLVNLALVIEPWQGCKQFS